MNEYDVRRLALILALQAEIEGMKAANKIREYYNGKPSYNEGHFQVKADALRNLAYTHNEQLIG